MSCKAATIEMYRECSLQSIHGKSRSNQSTDNKTKQVRKDQYERSYYKGTEVLVYGVPRQEQIKVI